MAAYAEVFSNHPIAVSILNAYGKTVNKDLVDDHEEVFGHGTRLRFVEEILGNSKLMRKENISYNKADVQGTIVM